MNNLTEDRKQYLIGRLSTRAKSLEQLEKRGRTTSTQQETLDAFRIAIAALTSEPVVPGEWKKRAEVAEEALALVREQRDLGLDRNSALEAKQAELYAEIYKLKEEVKGPDGFATWKDAAIAERLSKKAVVNIPNEIDYLTAMSAFHSDKWYKMGPISGYMHGWNACRAEVLTLNAVPPVQESEELSRLRDWVKCVEAERDKAIAWHGSLLKKYEQLKAAQDASTVGYIRANEVALLQRLKTHSCVEVAIYNTQAFRDDAAVFVRNADCQVGGEVAEVARAAMDYIDALPSEVVAALPAMPGFDRDWAEGVLKNETD